MAYSTLVCRMNVPEDDMRKAVRLVAVVLREIDIATAEESFAQRACSMIKRIFTLLNYTILLTLRKYNS